VGQKSGVVTALAPDAAGKIVWQTPVGKGSALGGVMWGMAADDKALYVPLSDQIGPNPGGVFALDPSTGRTLWSTIPEPRSAQAAAATAIPGVVFAGDAAGRLRAYSAATGEVLWLVETAKEYETVNGVKARGGSMSAGGVVVAGRMVFVNSGYGVFGGRPGNVLLAFGE
jgi:polyvinyl alcohol dehydrogenase (cytochrome)